MPAGREYIQDFGAPVLALCGSSGSGKTTLLEAAIPHLIARGLAVAVVKHGSDSFVVNKEGKDSERLFRAGATVASSGSPEQFVCRGISSGLTLEATLSDLTRDHDLLLVEGHQDTPLPKLWLEAVRRPALRSMSQVSSESFPGTAIASLLEYTARTHGSRRITGQAEALTAFRSKHRSRDNWRNTIQSSRR